MPWAAPSCRMRNTLSTNPKVCQFSLLGQFSYLIVVAFILSSAVTDNGSHDGMVQDDQDDSNHGVKSQEPLREQDRFLPIANVAKIMKKSIPKTGKVSLSVMIMSMWFNFLNRLPWIREHTGLRWRQICQLLINSTENRSCRLWTLSLQVSIKPACSIILVKLEHILYLGIKQYFKISTSYLYAKENSNKMSSPNCSPSKVNLFLACSLLCSFIHALSWLSLQMVPPSILYQHMISSCMYCL